MPYSRRFYENLPTYARLADEEKGILRHICDAAIQPELNKIFELLSGQEYFYDPNHPLSWDHLDWLGQFVGLGMIENHWLGIGINPDWSIAWKADIISRAWTYWQIKGTTSGIREAVSLWLRFDDKERFLLKLPYGEDSVEMHPAWWGYDTPYDDHLNKKISERKYFAWGNYWGQRYQANCYSIQPPEKWDYLETWSDGFWEYVPPLGTIYERSHLGDRDLWMHFYLKEWEWNQIFPNILTLNLEILPVTTTAAVFGWLEIAKCSCLLLERDENYFKIQTLTDFDLDGLQYGQLLQIDNRLTPQYELPDHTGLYIYAGDFYPYDTSDEYFTKEIILTEIEWGVWEPEYWDGQWWAKALLGSQGVETFSLGIDITDLGFVETLIGETLTIDMSDFPLLGFPGGELWYVPWETHQYPGIEMVKHAAIGCFKGIPFTLPGVEELSIDLGGTYEAEANQFLTQSFELEIPIKIATYFDPRDEASPFISQTKNKGTLSAAAIPMESFTVKIDFEPVETMAMNASFSGWLCNVFGAFSTFTPIRVRNYQIDITPRSDYSWADIYPIVGIANNGESWTVAVETDEEVFLLKPTTMFWYADETMIVRSPSFSFEIGTTNLYLEFLFKPRGNTHIQYAILTLGTQVIQSQNFYYPLNVPGEMYVGLIFKIPFRLPSSLDTPQEEVLLEEILPMLTQELRAIAGLPGFEIPKLYGSTPFLDCCMAGETLKELLNSLRETIRVKAAFADKHYLHIITLPVFSVAISHNLQKYPSVTFVDTIFGDGRKTDGTVDYVDINTVRLTFSEPTTGRVFFN